MVTKSILSTKVIAIVAAAVIVGAGVAVYAVTNNNGDNNNSNKIESMLMICGNADNNDRIDSADVALVQKIIDGKLASADYPLADANNDGKVDSGDIALINKMIGHESAKIFVLTVDADKTPKKVEVSYPLKNVVPVSSNMTMTLINVGGTPSTAGYFNCEYETAQKVMKTSNAVDLGGDKRVISEAAWQNFMKLDGNLKSKGGIGALLVDQSAKTLDTYRPALVAAGIPELRFEVAEAYGEIASALTIGFLLGSNTQKIAEKYATMSWDIINTIKSKTSKIADANKKSYICITMSTYVCQNDSDFNQAPEYAGGVKYSKVNAEFANKYKGNGSVKMASTEALSNYGSANYIISNRSTDYGQKDISATMKVEWNKNISYYEKLTNYKNMVYLNNLLPGICKIAYSASILYPEIFTKSWADGVMTQFMENFETLKGQTLNSVVTVFTYDDYVKS